MSRTASDMHPSTRRLLEDLFPILRSITGDGVRATLRRIGSEVAAAATLQVHEVPTGTEVLDWTVPDEWNLRSAHITHESGERVVDLADCNLHVVSYSHAVDTTMTLEDLQPHLHSLADRPNLIPYRTSYYNRGWGFCLSHAERQRMKSGMYRVVIDATLEPGSLTYGEVLLPGESATEILVSTHTCHPSLCNDNLSGIAIAARLINDLAARSLRHSMRFVFVPGTIGSLAWLHQHHDHARANVKAGLVLTGLGDRSGFTYKRSRRGGTVTDRAAHHVLTQLGTPHRELDFTPYGYDERQYCSPGYDLAVGRLGRGTHGEYPEYHTSGDNLLFVDDDALAQSFEVARDILLTVDADRTLVRTNPYGEPQLGRRGLYRSIGGQPQPEQLEMAMLWTLNGCDGSTSLLDIAERSGLTFSLIDQAASLLEEACLVTSMERSAP